MKRNIKIIYTIIITLIIGSFINVNASSNIVYVEGTYQQKNARNMLSLINNWRKDTTNNWYYDQNNEKVYPGELKPLTYDYGLEAIAMQRAAEIALSFSHTRPNEKSFATLQVNGYTSRGENIAGGYSAPENVFIGWQETDEPYSGQGHRRNMLSSYFTSIGIGCIHVPISPFRIYCAQEFGTHPNISTTPSEINTSKQEVAVSINTDTFSKEEVTLDNPETSILVGIKTTLPLANVKFYSNNTYTGARANLEWQITSGSEYITLASNEVTAKKKGTAVLKGTIGNSSVTYTINVKEPIAVTNISLNKTTLNLEKGKSETLTATITPTNAANKTITWKSSNTSVATVANGKVTAVSAGTATITATSNNGKIATCNVTVTAPKTSILYTTHVQNIGWQKYVSNGTMAGTSGKALRLEGIKIKLENKEYTGDIEYTTHVQNIGWQNYVKNDAMSGTSGKSLRLEGIRIKLTGEMADHYDVYYRVHAEQFGWLGWAKNGEYSGTAGYAFRLEGIEIKLVAKGTAFSEYGKNVAFKDKSAVASISLDKKTISLEVGDEKQLTATITPTIATNKTITWTSSNTSVATVKNGKITGVKTGTTTITATSNNGKTATCNVTVTAATPSIAYTTHVQYVGWQNYVKNGEMAGTSGKGLRLEGIKIKLKNVSYTGNVEYTTHVQNIGWQNYVKNDAMSGTSGKGLRLEGIKIKLTGEVANHYDIYYRVHAQNFGWLGWAKNGESSGTAGYAFRLEGIEIKLVEKNTTFSEYGKTKPFQERK